ncbi:hypothetical protein MOP88_08605 [Sphingomonas sp. WKB10]|nr:hypothetical protein [Sphingomonas sp. WKB10]
MSNAEDALHNVAGVRHDGKAIAQFYTSLRDVETIVPRLRIDQRSYALDPGIHGEIQTLVQGGAAPSRPMKRTMTRARSASLRCPPPNGRWRKCRHRSGGRSIAAGRMPRPHRSASG